MHAELRWVRCSNGVLGTLVYRTLKNTYEVICLVTQTYNKICWVLFLLYIPFGVVKNMCIANSECCRLIIMTCLNMSVYFYFDLY